MATNLLTESTTFFWNTLAVDRSRELDDLIIAYDLIKDHEDNVYITSNVFSTTLPWGEYHQILFWDDVTRETLAPWLSHDQQKILRKLFTENDCTPASSQTHPQLTVEFPNDNNGLITCGNAGGASIVYSDPSWHNFHSTYVSTFTFAQKCTNYKYFVKFYTPNVPHPNQIQQQINQGNVDPIFEGIHQPKIPHEKLHIHFVSPTPCALNIDGSWKHEVAGFTIPRQAIITLDGWGFLLPQEYYV